jgi:hypothetical protein
MLVLYDEAQQRGWTVASMKNDWKTIFPPDKKWPEIPVPGGSNGPAGTLSRY